MKDILRWWKEYRTRKHARELYKHALKLARMHSDILDASSVKYIRALCEDLEQALWEQRPHLVAELTSKLEKSLAKSFPRTSDSGWRENIEVFLVAAIVAMAIRTFFVQPFKIPTGSMQPTLYGEVRAGQDSRNANIFGRIIDCAVFGKWPSTEGSKPAQDVLNFIAWIVAGKWPAEAQSKLCGDHIFVDRFTYHFCTPKRGDVVVFDTNDIYEGLVHNYDFNDKTLANKFYIKRLVAVGGDHVEIRTPHLLLDGKILDERIGFKRMYSGRDGYRGYEMPHLMPPYVTNAIPMLKETGYDVPKNMYLAFGDNSGNSYDGRYWGAFPRRALIGRALLVYWPFTKRFGLVE